MRVGRKEGEWFQAKVGLQQGCIMLPRLFNLLIVGMVKEVNVRVLENRAGMESVGGS